MSFRPSAGSNSISKNTSPKESDKISKFENSCIHLDMWSKGQFILKFCNLMKIMIRWIEQTFYSVYKLNGQTEWNSGVSMSQCKWIWQNMAVAAALIQQAYGKAAHITNQYIKQVKVSHFYCTHLTVNVWMKEPLSTTETSGTKPCYLNLIGEYHVSCSCVSCKFINKPSIARKGKIDGDFSQLHR